MITFFFRRNGKTHFVAISPEIYEQIRVFKETNNISMPEIMELVYNRFGVVSQSSISEFLKERDTENSK